MLEASERERGPAHRLAGELDVGEPAHERPDCDRALEPRERCAEAEVVPAPEGDVAVGVLATEVEPVGLVELLGVAVRGAEQRDEVLRPSGS